jgi:hypothetical protein
VPYGTYHNNSHGYLSSPSLYNHSYQGRPPLDQPVRLQQTLHDGARYEINLASVAGRDRDPTLKVKPKRMSKRTASVISLGQSGHWPRSEHNTNPSSGNRPDLRNYMPITGLTTQSTPVDLAPEGSVGGKVPACCTAGAFFYWR